MAKKEISIAVLLLIVIGSAFFVMLSRTSTSVNETVTELVTPKDATPTTTDAVPDIQSKPDSLPEAVPVVTSSFQYERVPGMYFGIIERDGLIFTNLLNGKTIRALPDGYTQVNEYTNDVLPDYEIVKSESGEIFVYSYDAGTIKPLGLAVALDEGIRVYPSITEKDNFFIFELTYDLTSGEEGIAGIEYKILEKKGYRYDASVHALKSYETNDTIWSTNLCAQYDSKYERWWTWRCGEGVGSAVPLSVYDLSGKKIMDLVTSRDFNKSEMEGEIIGVKYSSGHFLVKEKNGGLAVTAVSADAESPVLERYTAPKDSKVAVDLGVHPYSMGISKKNRTIIIGYDHGISLLRYNENNEFVESKNIQEKGIDYVNHLHLYDGKLYLAPFGEGNIKIVDISTGNLKDSVGLPRQGGEYTLVSID